MNKYLKYTLIALLWAAVAGYIVWSAVAARGARAARQVRSVAVELADSTSQGYLVSAERVREWIRQSGIRTIGTAVDEVDLKGLEQMIARNGFVSRVDAYVTYSGVLQIGIRQRKPLVRLLADGYNDYITEEGVVFAAPRASSLYVPVVTGSYRLPFPPSYAGSVREYIDEQKQKIDNRIAELEREKYPFYRRGLKNDENIRELRRMRIKKHWWRFESEKEFEKRVEELRKQKASLRRKYRYEARLVLEGVDAVVRRQEAERLKQKKLEKSYEDFMKLLTFVKFVEEDDFWRSEVVQIVAHTAPSGALEVDLVPRSGRHTILFGRLENVEVKFDKLFAFYRSGLNNFGWGAYRTINIKYNDQVVCKK